VHYRDGKTPLCEVVGTLQILQKEGKIRAYGLSNIGANDYGEIEPFAGEFCTFQNEYSLACRKNEHDILILSKELAMTPMTWGSLGQGILTGKYDKTASFDKNDRRSRDIYVNFHGEKMLQNLEIVEVLKQCAANHGKPVAAAAIRFILDYLPGSVVLCGAKRAEQIHGNAEAADWKLDNQELEELLNMSK